MKLSEWRAIRNQQSSQRLERALPAIFPTPVLVHAWSRPLIPPTPRLAVDGYWRSHPVRADRLARALAAREPPPAQWHWRLDRDPATGVPQTFRAPPAPYREKRFSRGPGYCCVCGQPIHRLGWHSDLWRAGLNLNAEWHSACVVAWQLWNAPSTYARSLRKLQRGRCAKSGGRLWKSAEVDHRTPLFQVWRSMSETRWPALLAYWGVPNLQVINRDIHLAKCAAEAGLRQAARSMAPAAARPVLESIG